MFELSLLNDRYWIVALILVLLAKDRDEISGFTILCSSSRERKRMLWFSVLNNNKVDVKEIV